MWKIAFADNNAASATHPATAYSDAEVLLSLLGVGRIVAATMLSEASQSIPDRDYHGATVLRRHGSRQAQAVNVWIGY
jgi:hypothetical protein